MTKLEYINLNNEITKIKFPELPKITSIGDGFMYGCKSLQEIDLSGEIVRGVREAMTSMNQQDPQEAVMQVINHARAVIAEPVLDGSVYSQAVDLLAQYAPDSGELEQVLTKWAEVDAYGALAKRQDLMFLAQQAYMQQQEQQASQYYEQAAQYQAEVASSLNEARVEFAEQFPDWNQFGEGINEFLVQYPMLMERAAGDKEAIKGVFVAALGYAKSINTGGVGLPTTGESGSITSGMNDNQTQTGSENQALRDEARIQAALESPGSGGIKVHNQSASEETSSVPLSDLIGLDIVK
jgi:hypothetical protein